MWGDLNSLSLPGDIAVSYVYDSSGRRVSKTVGASVTYYLYAGSALVAELDGSGNATRQYTWGATGLVSDTTSGVGGGTQTRLYVFDGLGNTRALVDGTSGAILWQGGWSAWGQPNGSVGTGSAYGWHGQTGAYLVSESGLLQMGARYYAPSLGRFLTRDPSGFSAGANLYAFCMGDPIDFFDPNGCEGRSFNDSLWQSIRDAENAEKTLSGLTGLPGSGFPSALMGAHDAFAAWGSASGNPKVSAADTWKAGGWAAFHFANCTIQLALPTIGAMRALGEAEAVAGACKGDCFEAGTLVSFAHLDKVGQWQTVLRPIETAQAGEPVMSRNETTGKNEVKRIVSTSHSYVDATVSVVLAEAKSGRVVETITGTRRHPFFVEGKGFVPAGGLAIGNSIVTRAGPALVVKSVTWNRRAEGYDVFNFVVEDDHTYFVGTAHGGAWVHNVTCPRPAK